MTISTNESGEVMNIWYFQAYSRALPNPSGVQLILFSFQTDLKSLGLQSPFPSLTSSSNLPTEYTYDESLPTYFPLLARTCVTRIPRFQSSSTQSPRTSRSVGCIFLLSSLFHPYHPICLIRDGSLRISFPVIFDLSVSHRPQGGSWCVRR